MTEIREHIDETDGKVFVEFDSHATSGMGWSGRSSSAPFRLLSFGVQQLLVIIHPLERLEEHSVIIVKVVERTPSLGPGLVQQFHGLVAMAQPGGDGRTIVGRPAPRFGFRSAPANVFSTT